MDDLPFYEQWEDSWDKVPCIYWQRIWKPKYHAHLLALTTGAIYDICSPQTKKCGQLFKYKPSITESGE